MHLIAYEWYRSLSSDALVSMQILEDDFHPHAHNQGPTNAASGSKQGLSVFGLFQNLARTPQGKQMLRQYFLRPSMDLPTLNVRHHAITVLLQPDNELAIQNMVKSLKNISNMKTALQSLKKGMNNGMGSAAGMKSNIWFRIRSVRKSAYCRPLKLII